MTKKFNLKEITGKQWLIAVAVFALIIYMQKGGAFLGAASCPTGDYSCNLKDAGTTVLNWFSSHILLSVGIILFLGFFIWSQDLFKRKEKVKENF